MILYSYNRTDAEGKDLEFDLSPFIRHATTLVSASVYQGIVIQILTSHPEILSNFLPKWVHEEFYVFVAIEQLMIRMPDVKTKPTEG